MAENVIIDGINIVHDDVTHELVVYLHHAPEGALGGAITACKHKEGQIFTAFRMKQVDNDGTVTYTDVEPIDLDLYQMVDDIINNPFFDPSNN